MCGRYTLRTPGKELARLFEVDETPDVGPRYNIAPTQSVITVRAGGGGREFRRVRWGLVPSWADDLSIGNRMINARSETVAEKPAFRAALRKRRCLIPADGFYEWAKVDGAKQPYFIAMPDDRPFAFAGLWERWDPGDGSDPVETCTILTAAAVDPVKPLHQRMPVILAPESYARWLDPSVEDATALKPMLDSDEASRLTTRAVSKRVNSPANDTPDCLDPPASGSTPS